MESLARLNPTGITIQFVFDKMLDFASEQWLRLKRNGQNGD
jgi:hypothetical protein